MPPYLPARPSRAAGGTVLSIVKFGFGLLVAATLLAPVTARAADDSFFDAGRAQAGLQKIFNKAGNPTKALSLDIRANQLIAEVQDPANPQHVDAYIDRIATGTFRRWFNPESVSGARPVELNLINRDLDANLFALKPDDLGAVAKLAAASVKRAALEDPARIDRMELRRHLYLIPEPRSGDVEWSTEVTSGRERATVFANLSGAITHANLDGTLRAQRLNYLAGGKELDDAVAEIADVMGKTPTIRRLLVYNRSLNFEATNPDGSGRDSRFSAGINGVYRDLDDSVANIAIPLQAAPGRFAVTDADWSLVPKLIAAARERLGLPGGRIPFVELAKPDRGVGGPQIAWEINVESAGNSNLGGRVVFDNQGEVIATYYPPGKGLKLDMLEAANVAAAFAAMKQALGEHAAMTELDFRTEQLRLTARDPKKPDERIVLEYRGETLGRSILPPFDWPTFGEDWFFDLAAAEPAAARWEALEKDALTRLGLADGKVERITISKQKLFMPGNDRVLIEVRAESGKRGGRVVYDTAGKMVDIVRP